MDLDLNIYIYIYTNLELFKRFKMINTFYLFINMDV